MSWDEAPKWLRRLARIWANWTRRTIQQVGSPPGRRLGRALAQSRLRISARLFNAWPLLGIFATGRRADDHLVWPSRRSFGLGLVGARPRLYRPGADDGLDAAWFPRRRYRRSNLRAIAPPRPDADDAVGTIDPASFLSKRSPIGDKAPDGWRRRHLLRKRYARRLDSTCALRSNEWVG